MDPEKNKILHGIIGLFIGLILTVLCLEAFSILFFGQYRTLVQIMTGVLIILLIISLYLQSILHKKSKKIEHLALSMEKMEMRRAVEDSALRYKNLLECAGDAIFVINADTGQLEEMNGKGSEMFGYSRQEMERLNGKDLVPVPDQPTYLSLVRRIIRHGMANEECISFSKKDGGHFLGEVNARLIDLGGGKKVVQAIVRDITLKKKAEYDIRTRNRKLSILNDLITRISHSLDLNSVMEMALHESMELLGAEGGMIHLFEDGSLTLVAQKTFLGPDFPILEGESPTLNYPCRMATSRRCASLAEGTGVECAIALSARKSGWKSSAGIPLLGGKRLIGVMHILSRLEKEYIAENMGFLTTLGNQIGVGIAHARMFEELKLQREELLRSHRLLEKNSLHLEFSQRRLSKNLKLVEQANQELERLDKMKNQFIGMISHEFRTPLTSVISGTEFLMANHAYIEREEIRHIAELIHSSGSQLNETVSHLLKVVRIDNDSQVLSGAVIRLDEILDFVREGFDSVFAERGHRFSMKGVDSIPLFYGEREFLVEIFTQLLGNAVKFTPDGGEISISAQIVDRPLLEGKSDILRRFNQRFYDQIGCKYYMQLEIRDSGIGVAIEEQLKVFDKFYEIGDIRHHSTGKHKFQGKGTGLGLTIVKGMIEAHGGMIWMESPATDDPDNPGSAFFLLLPLEEDNSQSAFPFMHVDGPNT